MARPKRKAPTRRYHISGQSVVTLDGKDIYLGTHDSAESLARYAVLIDLYQKNGYRLPEDFSPDDVRERAGFLIGSSDFQPRQDQRPIEIRHLTAHYREFSRGRYDAKSPELIRANQVCNELDELAGNYEVSMFGPVLLQNLRAIWVKSGRWSRSYINRNVNLVIRIFKIGVANELVPETAWRRLQSIEPLRRGHSTARENKPRQPANLDDVRATAKHLSPIIRDMVRIQLSTGMRPSELCSIRPCDIDRLDSDCYMFRPTEHKTSHKGFTKAVPIRGDALNAILPYLERQATSYCFSPREAVDWYNEQKRLARVTPVQPSQIDRSKADPAKQPGIKYDSGSYAQAIKYGCIKAKVTPWTPYQLRHLAATAVRDAIGIEHAKSLLGHSEISMTERYSRTAEKQAIEAARHTPTL